MIEDFDLENVKSIEETDLKESLSMFSNLCIYLSLIFRYPDSNVYKSLRDYFDEFKFFLLDYELSSPDLPLQEDLEVEYVRLFVANYGGVIAPLYSSVYTSEEKLLLRDSTIKLRDIMHEEGFVLRDDVKDVEDNLYILFEFIGLLLSRALETDFRKISVAEKVLKEYVSSMVDDFSKRVTDGSKLEFYRVTAQFVAKFVRELEEFLWIVFDKNIV